MNSRFLAFSFVTVFSLVTATGGFCTESIKPWNITGLTSTSDCSFPMISGMTLVWQAKGGLPGTTSGHNDREIFLYDLTSKTVIQITDDDTDDLTPQTDGEYVVWQKHAPGRGNQIFLYRIQAAGPAGGSRISIGDSTDNYAPRIAAGQVVWTAQVVGSTFHPGQIMLYDAADGSNPVAISNPKVDCSNPRIDRQQVVWVQQSSDKTESLYIYDLTSHPGEGHTAPGNFIWNQNHSVDHQQTVLTRYDGTDREIVLYNRMDGNVRITDNELADLQPVISQNHIAWIAEGDIYLADIAEFMHVPVPDVIGGPGTVLLATWSEPSGGVDAYYLDVSTDPDFQSFVEGFRGLDVGTVTQYPVDGLTPNTTYYYRVHAQINGSTTGQSKSVTVKLITPAPSSGRKCTTLQSIYRLLLK